MCCDREVSTRPQAAALATFGDAPCHLGGELGVIAILHTWGQTLGQHLHLRCVVTGGALSRDVHGLRDVASCVSLPTSFRMRCDREASTRPQAAALATFGDAPRHLGGELGVIAILHTWGQTLGQHLHLHCVVTGGALSRDGTRWRPAKRGFLFPVRALTDVFRGKYLDGLRRAFDRQWRWGT